MKCINTELARKQIIAHRANGDLDVYKSVVTFLSVNTLPRFTGVSV
jgi:hypothetical protein